MAVTGLTAAVISVGVGVAAPTSAQAVPGALFGYNQCHAKGNAYKGTLFGEKVVWTKYKCVQTTGGYRLNVYDVSVDRKNITFAGSLYDTRGECMKAGARMRGTYKGRSVTWKEYACSYGTGDSRLYIDRVS